MTPTRRDLLRASGLTVAAGLAGCTTGEPMPRTFARLRILDSVETNAPVTVPVRIDLFVQNVDSIDAALRGVDVVALDAAGNSLATTEVGDFSFADADEDRRSTELVDQEPFGSVRVNRAEWSIEREIETLAVPTWITFDVREVWFGDDADGGASEQVVGRAAASQPPPHLSLAAVELRAESPLPATLGPDHYETHEWGLQRRDLDGGPFLPRGHGPATDATPTRSETG